MLARSFGARRRQRHRPARGERLRGASWLVYPPEATRRPGPFRDRHRLPSHRVRAVGQVRDHAIGDVAVALRDAGSWHGVDEHRIAEGGLVHVAVEGPPLVELVRGFARRAEIQPVREASVLEACPANLHKTSTTTVPASGETCAVPEVETQTIGSEVAFERHAPGARASPTTVPAS